MDTSNLRKDLDELFEKELTFEPTNQGETIDEIDYLQFELSSGKKSDLQQIHLLEFVERDLSPDDYLRGVKVEPLSSLKENNFLGIDASARSIPQLYVSAVIAQSAYGFFSYDQSFPHGEIYESNHKFILHTNRILKKGLNVDANNFPYREKLVWQKDLKKSGLTRIEGLSTVVTQIQARLETKALNDIPSINNFEKLNYVGIDGPLYNPLELNSSIKGVRQAFDNDIRPYGITKRSSVSTYVECLRAYQPSNNFFTRYTDNWFGNDREFLGIFLQEGYRTPFFKHVSRYEAEQGLPEDLYRICTYLRLPNHYIIRIELPSFLDEEDQPRYLNDMVEMIYKMTLMNNQKLPAHIDRADKIATITDLDVAKVTREFTEYFRSAKLPFGNLDDYK
jgi:hypothetical protein